MCPRTDPDRPESAALLANLEETRRDVVIPAEYEELVDAVDQYFGVRQVVEKLLNELFHPLRNLAEIDGHLKSLCGGMFHYFERTEARTRCAELVNGIFGSLYDSDSDVDAITGLVGTQLQLLDTLSRSRFAGGYRSVVLDALDQLRELQLRNGTPFLRFSGLTKRLGVRAAEVDGLWDRYAELYAGAVRHGLEVFEDTIDLTGWCRQQPGDIAADVFAGVAGPLAASIEAARSRLDEVEEGRELLELPNLDDLVDLALGQIRELDRPIERIALYVHLAGIAELQHRNMEILRALYFSIKTVCESGDADDIVRAVDLITDHLVVAAPAHKGLLFKCLEKLGRGLAAIDDDAIIRHLVERTIATGFEGPAISGVSEDWQTFVNPHHLPCLRTWLAIIESDPIKFEQLLSALVINLHFEGVFVSDTDLFQRDISALLNSEVADAFNLIMQLVTYFPVFYNELGSEGELRDVSTRIDEITHRRDPVIHYLRKQSHAESNNRLVGFSATVYRYWRTGDAVGLEKYLPGNSFAALTPEADWFRGTHEVAKALEDRGFTEHELDTVSLSELGDALADIEVGTAADRERVLLLVRLYQLLKAKYSYTPEHVLSQARLSPLVREDSRYEFIEACAAGDHLLIVAAGNRLLEQLKQRIVDSEVTEAFENIFHKRHIAAGIPSMYGTYSEPKFDSMGFLLRLMTFLKPHLEACVAEFNFRYMTRESIRHAHQIMVEMLRGLRIAGLRVQHLSTKLEILERGIALGTLSASQYLNIFDFMSEALNDVVQTNYIALHNPNLERMAQRLTRDNGDAGTDFEGETGSRSERFLRAIISSTYSIQEFDLFLRRIRQTLRRMTDSLSDRASNVLLNFTPNRLVSFIHDPLKPHEDQLCLGYKGYSLKRIKTLGLPVPDGFVVSTELFDVQEAFDYEELRADTRERLAAAVARLEEVTGLGFGDPERPLMLAARSGSAFSMPGMMDTILNVGINRELIERMRTTPEQAWGAWDCYRRYLQNVAMSCGADRDLFDDIMLRFKERYRVERKLEFTAAQMREMALEYRVVGEQQGVEFHDDPIEQLMQAVWLVLKSWHSESARLYRQQLQLAEGWGTAVIVQAMVFGNMSASSGSGVAFTRNPRTSTTGIGLFGDFTMRSQGEDVVAGLVHPLPVSEKQRREYSPQLDTSLETELPEIYQALKKVASQLINEYGYEHQEIEFTFESNDASDLHILQIRPMRLVHQETVQVFSQPDQVQKHLIGSGIGVSGGAMSGLVAFSEEDARRWRRSRPGSNVILLRPDTVPEDIGLVLAVDGLLTARGGFTSHAAVTAKRLGKCCVVNCKGLVVDDAHNVARIDGHVLLAGDAISIDGRSGRVYTGEHEVTGLKASFQLS
jgi:pyruvate,orthophosphate dikinase